MTGMQTIIVAFETISGLAFLAAHVVMLRQNRASPMRIMAWARSGGSKNHQADQAQEGRRGSGGWGKPCHWSAAAGPGRKK